MKDTFQFIDFPMLTDNEIDLILIKKCPANPKKDLVPEYSFKITLHNKDEEIGYLNLRISNIDFIEKYAGHIGYGIHEKFRGNKYAVKACNIVKQVALAHGLKKLYITCNPDNIASIRVCELLGCKLIEILDVPKGNDMYERGERKKYRYEFKVD